ncbi:MAG: rhodanese-like domain-containing protein [Anaerolineae bacterium]|nr:rhodanese-like domain-containing protein [Anaerolineae bacterium]
MPKTIQHSANRRPNVLIPLLVGGILIALLVSVLYLTQNPTTADSLPAEVSVAEAAQMREAGAFVLDVRQPEEWNQFHIPGATLIPLGELESRLDEIPADQPVLVVCRSGNRSATGRDILLEAGFSKVTSMAGGMNEWQALGYSTVSGP